MRDLKTAAAETLKKLRSLGIIEKVDNYSERFYDEPRYFYFGTLLSSAYEKILDENYYYNSEPSVGVGISFQSPHHALIKSLMESIERFCQRSVPVKKIRYSQNMDISLLHPPFFYVKRPDKETMLGWIEGRDMITGKNTDIPAQYVFLDSYHAYTHNSEPLLTPDMSTGTAAGFKEYDVILKGICEIIERDALMSLYLNSIPLNPLVPESIPYNSVISIIKSCERYLLTPFIFLLQTDLGIPVAMTILVDKTGYGPAVCVGAGCSIEIEQALIHSIEESLAFRFLIRRKMNELRTIDFDVRPSEITDNTHMQMYWSNRERVKDLSFWLEPEKREYTEPNRFVTDLDDVILLCKNKSIPLYDIDITPEVIRKTGISAHRIIMPTLQPFYADRTQPFINKKRIMELSGYYNKHTFTLNHIPHPIP